MKINNLSYIFRHIKSELFDTKLNLNGDDSWYYFLHIPKTAGTSFRYMLYDQFKGNQIYPNAVDMYLRQKAMYTNWAQFIENKNKLFSSHKKVLMGHFGIQPISMVRDSRPKSICFIRDPVKRILSSIHFHRHPGRRYYGLSIDQILKQFGEMEGTTQARNLGYIKRLNNLNQALDNLEQIDVIGISDNFDLSIRHINKAFGWNLKKIQTLNKSNYKSELSQGQLEQIQDYAQADMALYEHALRLFEQRKQTH